MFPINFRTAWFYLDQFPDSKNLRDYVPHCLEARGNGGIDVKSRGKIVAKAKVYCGIRTVGQIRHRGAHFTGLNQR